LVRLLRNYGQTAALSAGFEKSNGNIIITIDADLQNDPRDIPKLLQKMAEGYDVVSGWRTERHKESVVTRRIPSVIANNLISSFLGLKLNDFGCTLKAYKKDYIKPLKLYGEMHRFIPAYASWYGARITEVPVSYYPRKSGKSKYNLLRTFKVVLDLMTVKFLEKFITKPIYMFGSLGLLSFIGGIVSVFILVYNKISRGVSMIQSPILLLSALFVILGTMFICMGLLAELLVRIYYESQDKQAYIVKKS
jgi:glycosyltransferase involved in cell wall biosynthesis